MPKNKNYLVGYGKPPVSGQFKKGRSGNPGGRPKGTKNVATDIREELSERLTIREGDRTLEVSKQRAVIKALVSKSLKGDTRATALLLRIGMDLLDETVVEDPPSSAKDDAILDDYFKRRLADERRKAAKSTEGELNVSPPIVSSIPPALSASIDDGPEKPIEVKLKTVENSQ